MMTHSEHPDIARRAALLAPWAHTLFWIGAAGAAATVAVASFKSVAALNDWPAVGAALNTVLIQLLILAPTIALLQGVWAACAYLDAVSRGEGVDLATLKVMREIGDACVWAGVLAMLIVPNVLAWVRKFGGLEVRIEPEFLALTGLGLLLGLIGRVFAANVSRTQAAQAELDQIV